MWFYPKTGQISQISEQPRWIKILLSIQIVGIFTIEYLKPACLSTPGYWDYSSMMSTSRSQKVKQYDWSTVITSLPCRNLTFVSTSFLSQSKFRTIFCYGKKKKHDLGKKKKEKGSGKTLHICNFMKLHLATICPRGNQMLSAFKCPQNIFIVKAG